MKRAYSQIHTFSCVFDQQLTLPEQARLAPARVLVMPCADPGRGRTPNGYLALRRPYTRLERIALICLIL